MSKTNNTKKYILVATFVAELEKAKTKEQAQKIAHQWRQELPEQHQNEIEHIKVFEA